MHLIGLCIEKRCNKLPELLVLSNIGLIFFLGVTYLLKNAQSCKLKQIPIEAFEETQLVVNKERR
jgi:hypothetical protein